MASTRMRYLLFSGAALLATVQPALAQSNQVDRSTDAQDDDRTTNERPWQDRDGLRDRQSDGEDERRLMQRRDQRQSRRDERTGFSNRDRDPAIGVTVVERGGMGVRVMGVAPRSPAAQAGIQPGDTIIEVDGRRVGSPRQLVEVIQDSEAGDTAELAVVRDGRERQIAVRLSTREEALPAEMREVRPPSADGQSGQEQYGQAWQQGGDDDQRRFGQDANRWQFGESQPDQQGDRYNPPQPPQPPEPPSDATRQASYGDEGADAERERRFSFRSEDREPLGDRLAERLSAFEDRLERLTQRLEQLERVGGIQFEARRTSEAQNDDAESPSTSAEAQPAENAEEANRHAE